jgi:hypothetical protein
MVAVVTVVVTVVTVVTVVAVVTVVVTVVIVVTVVTVVTVEIEKKFFEIPLGKIVGKFMSPPVFVKKNLKLKIH